MTSKIQRFSLSSHTASGMELCLERINSPAKDHFVVEVPSSEALKPLHQYSTSLLLQAFPSHLHPAIVPIERVNWRDHKLALHYRPFETHVLAGGGLILKHSSESIVRCKWVRDLLQATRSAHQENLLHASFTINHLVLDQQQLRMLGFGTHLVAFPQTAGAWCSKERHWAAVADVVEILLTHNQFGKTPLSPPVAQALKLMRTQERPQQLRGVSEILLYTQTELRQTLPKVGFKFHEQYIGSALQRKIIGELQVEIQGYYSNRYDENAGDEVEYLRLYTEHYSLKLVPSRRNPHELFCISAKEQEPSPSERKLLTPVSFLYQNTSPGTHLWNTLREAAQKTASFVDIRSHTDQWQSFTRAQKLLELDEHHFQEHRQFQISGEFEEATGEFVQLHVTRAQRMNGENIQHLPNWLLDTNLEEYTVVQGRDWVGIVHQTNREGLMVRFKGEVAPTGHFQGTLVDRGSEATLERGKAAMRDFRAGKAVNPHIITTLLDPGNARPIRTRSVVKLFQNLVPAERIKEEVGRVVHGKPDLYCVQGPPGTGKTTFITEVIAQELSRQPRMRILVASQSRVAVSNVMERLKALREKHPELHITLYQDERDLQHSRDFEQWAEKARQDSAEYNHPSMKEWQQRIKSKDVETSFLKSAQVLGCTLMRLPQILKRLGEDAEFDLVVVDEAARAQLYELLMAMLLGHRVLLVGDHRQLPPHLEEQHRMAFRALGFREHEVKRTVFQELFEGVPQEGRKSLPKSFKHTLHEQYRMHPSIAQVVSTAYYQGQLQNGTITERDLHIPVISQQRALWADVHGHWSKRGTSWVNEEQAHATLKILSLLDRHLHQSGQSLDAAVICTYRAQAHLLRRQLASLTFKALQLTSRSINTVDAFQGQERDIVLHVGSRPFTASPFAADPQRLNVAFSRARRCLIVVNAWEKSINTPELASCRHLFQMFPAALWEHEHA